jgi:hypothetical protein
MNTSKKENNSKMKVNRNMNSGPVIPSISLGKQYYNILHCHPRSICRQMQGIEICRRMRILQGHNHNPLKLGIQVIFFNSTKKC